MICAKFERLENLDIVPFNEKIPLNDIILYKVNKMVYEKDEYATDKFISIISSMTYTGADRHQRIQPAQRRLPRCGGH